MNTNFMAARRRRRLTQAKLAARLRLNHADIGRIERHGWIPPAALRQRLARVLQATEAELFGPVPGRQEG